MDMDMDMSMGKVVDMNIKIEAWIRIWLCGCTYGYIVHGGG